MRMKQYVSLFCLQPMVSENCLMLHYFILPYFYLVMLLNHF